MAIYTKNTPAKFHPDPIRNEKPYGYRPKKNNMKMSSDMRSVL